MSIINIIQKANETFANIFEILAEYASNHYDAKEAIQQIANRAYDYYKFADDVNNRIEGIKKAEGTLRCETPNTKTDIIEETKE